MTALDTKALLTGVTPGPWTAWICGRTICVLGPKGDHNKPIVGWTGFDSCNLPVPKREANARLIASAPRLARRVIELEKALKLARAAAKHFNVRLSPNELAQVDAALKGEGDE